MLLTTIALALTMGTNQEKPLHCAIMGEEVGKNAPTVQYGGASYAFCCPGCDVAFGKDPNGAIKKNAEGAKATIGAFLFDPVSKNRVTAEKAKATVDYNGLRYYFESAENLAAFNKDAKKLSAVPKKESLVCPVMGDKIASHDKASSYFDYKDVRYYICCAGCLPAMTKDPAKYAGKNVSDLKVITPKKG